MKKITLEMTEETFKRLEEIQAYFGWNDPVNAGEFSLLCGISDVEELINFDKENKGK